MTEIARTVVSVNSVVRLSAMSESVDISLGSILTMHAIISTQVLWLDVPIRFNRLHPHGLTQLITDPLLFNMLMNETDHGSRSSDGQCAPLNSTYAPLAQRTALRTHAGPSVRHWSAVAIAKRLLSQFTSDPKSRPSEDYHLRSDVLPS